MAEIARLFISAAHKSSGKTTVSLGLCAALRAMGLTVQPFKKGPDFIDPLWLSAAADRSCRNLDHHTMSEEEILGFCSRYGATVDISIIEGNKGLYDGVTPDGRDSGAALARLLRAPVVLVIDCGGITRGVAPLLLGYKNFDPAVHIAGVILNKVSGSRHEAKLRQAVESYTGIPVLGAIHRSPSLEIEERHLGLVPANEAAEANNRIACIAGAISTQVDLERIIAIAQAAGPLPAGPASPLPRRAATRGRVGIASDAAFGFYYPEDIEALAAEGFEPVPFNTLKDPHLPPDLDGLFLGGGFPEAHMDALEANAGLRGEIRAAVTAGLPVYAECGGMMYLSRRISWQGRSCAMVGALEADSVMHQRPQGRGYVLLRETAQSPWPSIGRGEALIAAHEFHHASLENLGPQSRFAYEVVRGQGITGRHDGLVTHNTLASFSHLRGVGQAPWPARFAALMRHCADARRAARRPSAPLTTHGFVPALAKGEAPLCQIVKPSMPVIPSAPGR